jgi:N-acetylglutamate synthase-like GNAT family acetyltransferase
MVKVINLKDYAPLHEAVLYYHSKWGDENNFQFFQDAINHSSNRKTGLPRFYLLLKDGRIIGCCGLIINDFISRHDLYPWLCGLYIEENERGRALGSLLMEHAEKEAAKAGFKTVYLTTSHDHYYEKYGWIRMEDGYEPSGEVTKIYRKKLSD